jgi:cell division protein FtsA
VLRRAGLDAVDIVFEPIATARAVLTAEEMEAGCLLVDIGGSVTSYALYYGGCVRLSGVVALGGVNITSDLSIGLRTPLSIAERLKREHAVALTALAGEHGTVEVPGIGERAGKAVRTQIIAAIVEPRCEEICTMVKDAVSADPYYRLLGGGIVLTGGGSNIAGIDGVAEQVFDLPARVGLPRELGGLSEMAGDAALSAGVGLMLHECDQLRARRMRGGNGGRFGWVLNGLKRSFTGLFEKEGGEHEIRV